VHSLLGLVPEILKNRQSHKLGACCRDANVGDGHGQVSLPQSWLDQSVLDPSLISRAFFIVMEH